MGDQPAQPFGLVEVQPVVEGVRVPFLQQAVFGYPVGSLTISDLQQGGATLSHIGMGIVIAMLDQFLALFIAQRQCSESGHLLLLSNTTWDGPSMAVPILIVKTH
jgi:hypothetical protein